MPTPPDTAKACPKCGGTTGHEHYMTETHLINGTWGADGESGDSGIDVKHGWYRCLDCNARFSHQQLVDRGLLGPRSG